MFRLVLFRLVPCYLVLFPSFLLFTSLDTMYLFILFCFLVALLGWAFLVQPSPKSLLVIVTDGTAIYHAGRTKHSATKIATISAFVKAKLQSPLRCCPRCGPHAPNVLCYPPDVMDGASHDIFLGLLNNTLGKSRPRLAHVLDVAEYQLLDEEYLERLIFNSYVFTHFSGAWFEPTLLLSIRDLYMAGSQSLAKKLYILWDCHNPRRLNEALTLFPDSFADTDFFGTNDFIFCVSLTLLRSSIFFLTFRYFSWYVSFS